MRAAVLIVLVLLAIALLVGPMFEPQLRAIWRKLEPAAYALVMSGVSIGLGVGIAVGVAVAVNGWPRCPDVGAYCTMTFAGGTP